jgi:altronate dehydratase
MKKVMDEIELFQVYTILMDDFQWVKELLVSINRWINDYFHQHKKSFYNMNDAILHQNSYEYIHMIDVTSQV